MLKILEKKKKNQISALFPSPPVMQIYSRACDKITLLTEHQFLSWIMAFLFLIPTQHVHMCHFWQHKLCSSSVGPQQETPIRTTLWFLKNRAKRKGTICNLNVHKSIALKKIITPEINTRQQLKVLFTSVTSAAG